MKLKISKNKVIAAIVIITVLAVAFWYGGGAPGLQGWNISPPAAEGVSIADKGNVLDSIINNPGLDEDLNKSVITDAVEGDESEEPEISKEENPAEETEEAEASDLSEEPEAIDENETKNGFELLPGGPEGGLTAAEKIELAKEISGGSSPGVEQGLQSYSESQGMKINAATGKDKYLTDPVPEGKPIPVEPQESVISDVEYTCVLSVRCDTILDNLDWLDPEKVELVPEDGVIYATQTVTFYEGESVFNVLQREMKKAKIHMEFSNTPIYNSAYIEGIHNLYEFDCGELSGWMYKVNNWFPNYGCSRYALKDGDVIEWVYTCDLGVDVGGFFSVGS